MPTNGDPAPAEEEKEFPFQFPPFPPVPPGKTIIPFKSFKAKGVRPPAESDDEGVDGDGMKTTKLGTVHLDPIEKAARDRAKRAKKRRKGLSGKTGAGIAPLTAEEISELKQYWYEEWEDKKFKEKVTPVHPASSREERFIQIIADFQADRQFPRTVQSIWDNFRLFVGLMENPHNPPGSKHIKGTKRPEPGDDEDSGQDTSMQATEEPPPLPRGPKAEGRRTSEAKMERFLDDMEESVKIFFTSFSYERGMLWDSEKRRNSPILIEYLLDYIRRHRTMPEFNLDIERSLRVVECAKIEQPAIGEIADLIPDPFMVACRECWGRWSDKATIWSNFKADVVEPVKEKEKDEKDEKEREKEREQKQEESQEEVKEKEEEPEATPSQPVQAADDVPSPSKESSSDRSVDLFGAGLMTEEEAFRGANLDEVEEWGGGSADIPTNWGESDNWGGAEPTWGPMAPPPSLTEWYGKVPESHVMVRVESGLRRLEAVEAPSPNAVSEFRKPVGVLVMAPWPIRSNNPQSFMPYPTMMHDDVSEAVDIPPHDAVKGTIRVYCHPDTAEKLKDRIGMGLSAYWIQVAQKKGGSVAVPATSGKKKKSKASHPDVPSHWWYCEDSFQVMQTYWTEEEPEPRPL
ncbi:hypothetical protein FRB99_008899 [Tulasnella sp. 403]|nr:hypothetical protein FRB99_008899 [Tulasnella sp. 403]